MKMQGITISLAILVQSGSAIRLISDIGSKEKRDGERLSSACYTYGQPGNFDFEFCNMAFVNGIDCSIMTADNYEATVGSYEWPRQMEGQKELIPAYGCNPKNRFEVQKILYFANSYDDVKVNFKNNGHSYFAASGEVLPWQDDSKTLLVSVRFLNGLDVWADGYFDTKLQWHSGPVAKVEGGVTLEDLYKTMSFYNYVHIGGSCESVGLGGWITLGGLSAESGRTVGLGVDSIMQFEVMLSDGTITKLDEFSKPDLFMAMKGGGSGFALILSMLVKLFPGSEVQKYQFGFTFSDEYPVEEFNYAEWYTTLARHVNPDAHGWAIAPMLMQGNSSTGITGGVVNMTFIGSHAEAQRHTVYTDFKSLVDKVPSKNKLYSEERWDTFSSFKYETRLERGWDATMATPMNWMIPSEFFENEKEAGEFLQELDLSNLQVDGCDTPTWGYHFGGKYAENIELAKHQTAGYIRRKAAVGIMVCSKKNLRKLTKKFPPTEALLVEPSSDDGVPTLLPPAGGLTGQWSPNHYQWCEDMLGGVDFVKTNWGVPTYKFLLKTKIKYDENNIFGCAYCVAWPPISQGYNIMKSKKKYSATLSMKHAELDCSALSNTFELKDASP